MRESDSRPVFRPDLDLLVILGSLSFLPRLIQNAQFTETPTSSDSNHSSISFSGNPDIICESQRRRCANVAIIDKIIALALDLNWRQ
ncbi:hypothetical protein Droror1_Dr00012020, partial [Drosera rotundifolia]